MKYPLIIAAIVAAFAIAACGKEKTPETTAPAETTQPTQPITPPAQTESQPAEQPAPAESQPAAQPAPTESQPAAAPATQEQKEEKKSDEQTPTPSEQK